MSEKYEMINALEQERNLELGDYGFAFDRGASAALRILSEQEGREFWIDTTAIDNGKDEALVFLDKEEIDDGYIEDFLHVTEAAPLRARVQVLEEKLEFMNQNCISLGLHESRVQQLESENADLKAENDKLRTEKQDWFNGAALNDLHIEQGEQITTLRAQIEELQSANAVLKSEKSSLMRSLSQYCGDA